MRNSATLRPDLFSHPFRSLILDELGGLGFERVAGGIKKTRRIERSFPDEVTTLRIPGQAQVHDAPRERRTIVMGDP